MSAGLAAAGTALKILGQFGANMGQAESELQNAAFYREQAKMSQFTKFRELSLISRQYTRMYGETTSAYAAGGVDTGSGSAAMVSSLAISRHAEEAFAITKKYDLETKLAKMRGAQAQSTADTLRNPFYNAMQATSTALTSYASFKGGESGGTETNYFGSGPMSPGGGSYLMGSSGGYGSGG